MALIKGGVSGASLEVGATSKGAHIEVVDSSGKLLGATKVIKVFHGINFTAATTEGMVSLTPVTDGVNGTPGTTHAITAGKRLVLLGMSVVTKNAGAAAQGVICRLRWNPGGAAIVSSPIVTVYGAGSQLAVANVVGVGNILITAGPLTGIELPSGGQIGISQIGTATAGNDVCLWGYEY